MPTNAIALTRLLLSERLSLLRLALRIVGTKPAAEDVTQSLWLRLQHIEDDPPIANKRAYLYRLAANLATDHLRASRCHDALFDAAAEPVDVSSQAPSAERSLLDRERLARFEAALEELPLRCRQVFVLRRIDGLPPAEVAERLGITVNAVAKHVRIALRHCHARMKDDAEA